MNLIDWSLDEKLIVARQKDLFLFDHDAKKVLKQDLKDDKADKNEKKERPIISSVKWQPWKELHW
jgi:hypothetical protein